MLYNNNIHRPATTEMSGGCINFSGSLNRMEPSVLVGCHPSMAHASSVISFSISYDHLGFESEGPD